MAHAFAHSVAPAQAPAAPPVRAAQSPIPAATEFPAHRDTAQHLQPQSAASLRRYAVQASAARGPAGPMIQAATDQQHAVQSPPEINRPASNTNREFHPPTARGNSPPDTVRTLPPPQSLQDRAARVNRPRPAARAADPDRW